MQTSTPKRTRLVYPPSPLRRDQDSDDFSDMPEYIPPIKTVHRRGPRGRDAINEIAQIVGSKRFRDIKRSGNFMPGQFEIWNAKETGGNKQYWGGYQDVDGDGLAHEFVVRREKETGPMVAVNGYTTKRSDWAARKTFYENNPSREDRKGKTVKTYMRDEYYNPEYEGMQIKSWGVEPGSENDDFRNDKEWSRYIKYTPKEMSPYQAVNKYIFMPALKLYLDNMGVTQKDYLAQNGGVAVLSRLLSEIYGEIVKGPVSAYLQNKGYLDEFESDFVDKKGYDADDPRFAAEFDKYVFSKKAVRDLVKSYYLKNVQPQTDFLIAQYAERIDGNKLKAP